MPELLQEVLDRGARSTAYEAERTIEARGRIENLEAFVDGAGSTPSRPRSDTLRLPQEISLYSDQDALTARAMSP